MLRKFQIVLKGRLGHSVKNDVVPTLRKQAALKVSIVDAIEVSELEQRKQPFRPSFLFCGVLGLIQTEKVLDSSWLDRMLVLIQTAGHVHSIPKGFQRVLSIHHPAQGVQGQPPCWVRKDALLIRIPYCRGDRGDPDHC